MITTLDEAVEQNKKLVAEAFRVTQKYIKSQAELQKFKNKMNPGALPFQGEREEVFKKLSRAEEELLESKEINKQLTQILATTEQQYHDADRRAKEANDQLFFQLEKSKKKDELQAGKLKLNSFGDSEGVNNIENSMEKNMVDELTAQLKDKEKTLAVFSDELIAAGRLLEAAQAQIQKLNDERLLLFEHSKKLKIKSSENEDYKQKFTALLETQVAKENEIQQARLQNYQLADAIFKFEAQFKQIPELKAKNMELENELKRYKIQQATMLAPPMVNIQPMSSQPNYSGSDLMSQVMENMKQMQLEIERLNQQQSMQSQKY